MGPYPRSCRSSLSCRMAEREGFEPSNTFWGVTHFPGERLRPLGHLSATAGKRSERGRKGTEGAPLRPLWGPGGLTVLAGQASRRGRRLPLGRLVQAGLLGRRRRRCLVGRGDGERALRIRDIEARRYLERGDLHGPLILLGAVTARVGVVPEMKRVQVTGREQRRASASARTRARLKRRAP